MDNFEMLKLFSCYIKDEIGDIEKYAKQAIKWKDARPDIAEAFANLGKQEATHYQNLHDMRVKLIKYAADGDNGLSADEMAVYEYMKDCEAEALAKAKEFQDIYKEM